MSGEISLRRPRPRAWHEKLLEEILQRSELRSSSSTLSDEQIRQIPASTLVNATSFVQIWSPTIEQDFLSVDGLNLSNYPPISSKCRNIMIGDMSQDVSFPCPIVLPKLIWDQGSILKTRLLDDCSCMDRVRAGLDAVVNEVERQKLIDAYDLESTEERAKIGTLQLVTELRFYAAVVRTSHLYRNSQSQIRYQRYHMHQVCYNPWIR